MVPSPWLPGRTTPSCGSPAERLRSANPENRIRVSAVCYTVARQPHRRACRVQSARRRLWLKRGRAAWRSAWVGRWRKMAWGVIELIQTLSIAVASEGGHSETISDRNPYHTNQT